MHIFTPIIGIEISRKCNLYCTHCMRGEAESLTINKEILEKFFDEVKSANVLVISGGEPFICYDEIKMLIQTIREKHVLVPNVIIVTNGTIYDERIYKILEDNFEGIEINISIDNYHMESIVRRYDTEKVSKNPRLHPMNLDEIIENIKLHKSSPYFGQIYGKHKYLIDIGRATDLNEPKKPFDALGYFYTDCAKKFIMAGPQIYLDSLGYITDGNSQYASRDKISIGNINNTTLCEMLIRNAIKIDCSTPLEFSKIMQQREYDYRKYKGKNYIYKDNKIIEEEQNKEKVKQL